MPPLCSTPSSTAKLAALAENADPELVKLFIEEAREELVKIERAYPVWDQNPLEREALVTVRRSFHTLKGSGRMVGARELGELAWAVENLLNRVLDNTLTRSPAILEAMRDAIAALPQMIDHLEKRSPVTADVAAIAARAHALAAGRDPIARWPPVPRRAAQARVSTAEPPSAAIAATATEPEESNSFSLAPEPAMPPAEAEPEAQEPAAFAESAPSLEPPHATSPAAMDEALREIYTRETGAHVATIRAYLNRESQLPEPHAPSRGRLSRLPYAGGQLENGAGAPRRAAGGAARSLAAPRLHQRHRPAHLDLTLLADCMAAMESVAAHLDEPTGYFVNHWQLLERLAEAERALDADHGSRERDPRVDEPRRGRSAGST